MGVFQLTLVATFFRLSMGNERDYRKTSLKTT